MALSSRNWNQGDLAKNPFPMDRERATHRRHVAAPVARVFELGCFAGQPGWLPAGSTRLIFAEDPSFHTYSIHNEHWGPTEAVASTSIALGAEVGDETFLGVLRETLPGLVEAFRPGLVVFLAGAGDRRWRRVLA